MTVENHTHLVLPARVRTDPHEAKGEMDEQERPEEANFGPVQFSWMTTVRAVEAIENLVVSMDQISSLYLDRSEEEVAAVIVEYLRDWAVLPMFADVRKRVATEYDAQAEERGLPPLNDLAESMRHWTDDARNAPPGWPWRLGPEDEPHDAE